VTKECERKEHMELKYTFKFLIKLAYILESNPHPFYSFRGIKNQMWIRFEVESWILEKLCTADNSTTFVQNLMGAFGISSSYTPTPAPFGA
jgi:hypothetical protein